MPQMDFAMYAPQIVWLVITFAVLYFLMARAALPRIAAILAARDAKITNDLNAAQAMKVQADAAQANYDRIAAETRANAQRVTAAAREVATALQAKEIAALDARLAEQARKADAGVAAARAKAMDGLRDLAAELAQVTAEKLLGAKVDRQAAAKAVDAELKKGS